jgi:hypothetical protein
MRPSGCHRLYETPVHEAGTAELPGESQRELPGEVHLHLHGVSAEDVAEILRREIP